MPKSANQKIKILYLMRLFQEKTDEEHGLTLAEITAELAKLGVAAERKTLYDDIEILRVFGLDIEQRKEKNTVRYHLVSRDFELPELKLLVDAVQASKFITEKKSVSLIKKLQKLSSRYQAQQLGRQVHVANRIKNMNESIYYNVDRIHEAVSENKKISFQYFEWNENKERFLRHDGKNYIVSPWHLAWDDENYYLIAYDSESEKIKHYRIDKMLRINILTETRDGAEQFKDFDTAVYSKKTFGMYGGKEELVTLRCNNKISGIIVDRFGSDTPFTKSGDESFDITVRVAVSPLFLTWLMNFGENITVISPESVKKKIIELAKATVAQYD